MTEIKAALSTGLRRTWRNAGSPSDGPTGTLYDVANIGDLLVDTDNKKLYMNKGTKTSPTWTELAASGAALASASGEMATNGTGTANVLGASSAAAPINHIHKIGTHDHSDDTKGDAIVLGALGTDFFADSDPARAKFATDMFNAAFLGDVFETDCLTNTILKDLVVDDAFDNTFLKAAVNDDSLDNTFCDAAFAAEAFAADSVSRAFFANGIWEAAQLATDSVTTIKIVALNVTSEKCEVGLLSADTVGRALMSDGFFTSTEVLGKFGTNSFDATACADVFDDGAIPTGKINWSFGSVGDITALIADASNSTGSEPGVARIDHGHEILCDTPSGAHVPDCTNAEGSANEFSRADHRHALPTGTPSDGSLAAANSEGAGSEFSRDNHVHKAILLDDVSFNFGTGSDVQILLSTANNIGGGGAVDLVIALADLNHALHLVDVTAKATDFDVANATDPTIYIHSDTTPITDYMLLYHDGSDAIIDSMGGNLLFKDTGVELLSLEPTLVMFNAPGADINFTIQTNDVSNMFNIDGGENALGIGVAGAAAAFVKISNPAKTLASAAEWVIAHIAPAGATTTNGDTSTYDYIASLYLEEPNIVNGGGDTITLAATLLIKNAPTEAAASANYALYIEAGLMGTQALTAAGLITSEGGIAMLATKLDFTTGYIEFGATNPAESGAIRVPNNTAVWVSRNAAPSADITGWKVNAEDDYEAAADVNLGGNSLIGDTAADGDLTLIATTSGTKASALIIASQHLDATADGVATFVLASTSVGDGDYAVTTPENGSIAIASDNGRLYYKYLDNWHYAAQSAGFEVPKDETDCPKCGKAMKVGQSIMGEVEYVMADGALHGLWCHATCPV